MTVIALLIAALIVVVIAIAYVVIGRDKLELAWDGAPGPLRTVVNVFVSGSVLVVVAAVVKAQGVTDVDWPATGTAALNAGVLGVATAIGRALNPLDDSYGLRKAKTVEGEVVDDAIGEH